MYVYVCIYSCYRVRLSLSDRLLCYWCIAKIANSRESPPTSLLRWPIASSQQPSPSAMIASRGEGEGRGPTCITNATLSLSLLSPPSHPTELHLLSCIMFAPLKRPNNEGRARVLSRAIHVFTAGERGECVYMSAICAARDASLFSRAHGREREHLYSASLFLGFSLRPTLSLSVFSQPYCRPLGVVFCASTFRK